jgi:hypothetical protein
VPLAKEQLVVIKEKVVEPAMPQRDSPGGNDSNP